MAKTVKLAEYLFTRLRQLGVDSMHGVPGDFNLTLLDFVEPAGLLWVGNANELNAGYAADGYARTKGVGALITTFGVGELSAINAIAGAYAERAAVVHIVGTPGRPLQDDRVLVHHTFKDGDFGRFAQMHKHVTVAQTNLKDPRTCPEQIDQVLTQCLVHNRPVYIEVPVDMVAVPVLARNLEQKICIPDPITSSKHDEIIENILSRLYNATQPAIIVDGECRALHIMNEVQELVKVSQWPTFTSPFGKSIIDESIPNFHGIYRGSFGKSEVKQFLDSCDLVLCFGPHFSTTNTNSNSSIPPISATILFTQTEVKVGSQVFRDTPAKYAIDLLLSRLDRSQLKCYDPYPELGHDSLFQLSTLVSDQAITQDKLWPALANFLKPGDIIMAETGSPGYGVRSMLLPPHTQLFTAVTWLSIGYMLPAAQGAALAQRELVKANEYHSINNPRTVLFIGDGSFQMTVQELGTIIRLDLDVVIFLINNDGYTIGFVSGQRPAARTRQNYLIKFYKNFN